MNAKITCPFCSRAMSIKDPKPGKYKPKCSGCSEVFAIVVEKPASENDEPKIRVGKLAATSSPKKDENKTVESTQVEATQIESPNAEAKQVDAPEVPAGVRDVQGIQNSNISKPSGFDVTMEQPSSFASSHATGVEETIDSSLQANRAASGFESTRDDFSMNASQSPVASQLNSKGTPEAASQAKPSAVTVKSSPSQSPAPNTQQSNTTQSSSLSTNVNRLGGYRIVKELGAGGMGSVYLARQISLDRPCALKTIQAQWAQNPRVVARFIREAYAAAQLTHHNVVQIYDLGQDNGTNYFSMELVSGGSLDDQLKAKGKLPPRLAATLVLQAARGIKFAHDHGMVHRDIKPANLMMTSDGLVKVADMGLVKTPSSDESIEANDGDVQNLMLASARSQVTAIGSSMGTPAYMSPEQSSDAASVDKRADIYSLGCTFYALLTGRPPFDGNTMLEVITKHRNEKLVRPERIITGLPAVLGDIIEKMTEKRPEDRYQDLEETIHDLEVYLELREDTAHVKVERDVRSMNEQNDAPEGRGRGSDDGQAGDRQKNNGAGAVANADVPTEQAAQLQLAAKRFNASPLLLVRRMAPLAWNGVCGGLCVIFLLLSMLSGLSMLTKSASNLYSQAKSAIGAAAMPGDATTVVDGENAAGNSPNVADESNEAVQSNSIRSANSPDWDAMISRFMTSLFFALAMVIAPVAAIACAGMEGNSPLAMRWRHAFLAGGYVEWFFWAVGSLAVLAAIYFIGLWFPVVCALIIGGAAGATYYYGIEKTLRSARVGAVDSIHATLKQLRLRGMDEQRVREVAADHSGKEWEELFETLFGYDSMRAMRKRLHQSKKADLKVFRANRDRWIDKYDEKLSDVQRDKDEQTLSKAEQAELVASGVSDAEARKQASLLAATMVDVASETRKTMQEIAAGELTSQAAEAKRQRIKQMLAEARTGKMSKRELKDRSLDRMLGQLLGSKFRFVCASMLLLGVGLWMQANQKAVAGYWQHARTTASSAMESLKNTSLDAQGLSNATGVLNSATEQAKTAISSASNIAWSGVLGGLVNERNVLFIAIAGLLMLWGSLMHGWRVSLIFVPVTLLVCILPMFLFR